MLSLPIPRRLALGLFMNDLKNTANSRTKVLKGWALLIGLLVGYAVFWLWTDGRKPSPGPAQDQVEGVFAAVGRLFVGMLGLGFGAIAYTAVILTRCFTFDFQKPIWPGVKARLY